MVPPLKCFTLCSPRTHRTASTTLLLLMLIVLLGKEFQGPIKAKALYTDLNIQADLGIFGSPRGLSPGTSAAVDSPRLDPAFSELLKSPVAKPVEEDNFLDDIDKQLKDYVEHQNNLDHLITIKHVLDNHSRYASEILKSHKINTNDDLQSSCCWTFILLNKCNKVWNNK